MILSLIAIRISCISSLFDDSLQHQHENDWFENTDALSSPRIQQPMSFLRGGGIKSEPILGEIVSISPLGVDDHHRRNDEVERVGSLDCKLTTSMQTERYTFQSDSTVTGIMFTIQSSAPIDLLSLEYGAFNDAQAYRLEVYYREGSFSGFHNRPESWTKIADTVSIPTTDKSTAIVPAADFETFSMKADTEYALYISMESAGTLKVKTTSQSIGAPLQTDGILSSNVGVLLTEGPFPDTLGTGQAANFEGVLHYSTIQSCEDKLTNTDVVLEFAINDDPGPSLMQELEDSIRDKMTATIILNKELSLYRKNHFLDLLEVTPGFAGRDGKNCCVCLTFFSNICLIRTIYDCRGKVSSKL